MSTLTLKELRTALARLDDAKAEFKEHPMYNEWLEPEEVNCMREVCEEEPEEEYVDLEDMYQSYIDNLRDMEI